MEELLPYIDFFTVDFSNIPINSDKAGVIVEGRCHPMLELVLKNFVYMLPDWSLIIFHIDSNREYIDNILGPNHSVTTIQLDSQHFDVDSYNRLLKSEEFYHRIPANTILIFQCDSFIRRRDIHRFMRYSYVGAPWVPLMREVIHDDTRVGNGGLSLRNKDTMLTLLNQPEFYGLREASNEDVFFSIGMNRLQLNACPLDVATSFSVEQVYYPNPFGWHQVYRWLPEHWDEFSTIELDILLLYGANDTFIDITPQEWHSIQLYNYNDIGGDPVPGVVKELRVISQDLDKEVIVTENTPITISKL